jgi:malate/lactate dehydrogenase
MGLLLLTGARRAKFGMAMGASGHTRAFLFAANLAHPAVLNMLLEGTYEALEDCLGLMCIGMPCCR